MSPGAAAARIFDIISKLGMARGAQPYGDGFWSERFRFLDYTGSRFIEVQEKLLLEHLASIGSAPVAGTLLGGVAPASVSEFMRTVPLTTIEDYAEPLKELRHSSGGRDYTWAYTMYGAGQEKWIPYTEQALSVFADSLMGSIGLAARSARQQNAIKPGARVVYNVPPRPYLAGIAAFELVERFGLRALIPPEIAEDMEFEERIHAEFRQALSSGVDILISMTSVLRRISQRFASGLSSGGNSGGSSVGIRAAARYAAAKARAKISGRSMLPRDLWKPKAVIGWGLDTRHYTDQIASDWGSTPFEMYAATESGVMGLQYDPDAAIAINPETCFFEFMPESEIEALRNDPKYTPQTTLLPDVTPGNRYEIVITSFYGMPFVRYRTGHLVRSESGQLGYGPDIVHVGRTDDRLDIGGFTRIDESTIWKAVSASGVGVVDWIVRRETESNDPTLHVYAELGPGSDPEGVEDKIHASLQKNDPLYADLVGMLGLSPLRVTVLNPGTFSAFYEERRISGDELLARRPQRVNAPQETVDQLLALSSHPDGEVQAA